MQVVRYLQTWFHVTPAGHSEAKFEVGKVYEKCEETLRHIAHGIAELIDAPDDPEKAEAAAEKAAAEAAKAAEKAEAARATAEVAVAASELVK